MQKYFAAIKTRGFNLSGERISATQSINLLLDAGLWPLFNQTCLKNQVAQGDIILTYAAGRSKDDGKITAIAEVIGIEEWQAIHNSQLPISLDKTPVGVLLIKKIKHLKNPVEVKEEVSKTSFSYNKDKNWGVHFMQSLKELNENDFKILSGENKNGG